MRDRQSPSSGSSLFDRLKRYFGFAEPSLTWRQRCAIFAENERRSWARLLGVTPAGRRLSPQPEPARGPGSSLGLRWAHRVPVT